MVKVYKLQFNISIKIYVFSRSRICICMNGIVIERRWKIIIIIFISTPHTRTVAVSRGANQNISI